MSGKTIVVSTGWLAFISIFNYFLPTWNKDKNNNNIYGYFYHTWISTPKCHKNFADNLPK